MKAYDIPNLISIARIILVAPTVYYLLNLDYKLALVLFFIAGASDGVDGFLARHFEWQTRLGAVLDPIGDKLLLVSCYLALGWLGHLPVLLVVLVILRDVVIVTGAIIYHMYIEEVSIKPLMVSKLNTVLQISLVILIIFSMSDLPLSNWANGNMINYLTWLVYGSTIASGVSYVWAWGQRAMSISQQVKSGD